MIKKQGNKFVVTNKAGTKVLGTHASKEKAQKQLAAIEISKAKHMHENKTFKAFRSTLNESEYSEVLTGYGNRSAHKDDAGLHHLQSAGALAGINAMLATIGKGTYLDPNEAFLKMKVRLNVVQLDFAWKPGSWDGGVGSFDIPVVQFGRVDGYDAQTGQIRFDGKANPTGGYTELNLHVDVELTPESLYVVSAKLSPAATVAESVEVAEDLQTPAREREMKRKIDKADDAAQRAYQTRMTKTGTIASRASKQEDKHERKLVSLLKRDEKEYSSPRTYGRGGKLVKRGSRAEVKEDLQTPERKKQMKRRITRLKNRIDDTHSEVEDFDRSPHNLGFREVERGERRLRKLGDKLNRAREKNAREKQSSKVYGIGGKVVKEEMEQIDEAGAAKLARMGYAYDRARIGSRGVNNPERKQQMRDAYYKQREKVEANKAKRVAAGTFDKGRELEALHKKYEIRRAKNAVKEEIEQIDELSKATKDSYVAKRGSQLSSMMYGSGKHYASLTGKQQANAVKGLKRATGQKVAEALIGGQKKLDLNKNKRLDSQDFALLRAKKKAVSEAKKPMIKIGLNPNKKIGYEVASIGAGGKKTVEKSVDYTMPHKPKKTILTQKVQDGKKMGSPRPIAKYEGK